MPKNNEQLGDPGEDGLSGDLAIASPDSVRSQAAKGLLRIINLPKNRQILGRLYDAVISIIAYLDLDPATAKANGGLPMDSMQLARRVAEELRSSELPEREGSIDLLEKYASWRQSLASIPDSIALSAQECSSALRELGVPSSRVDSRVITVRPGSVPGSYGRNSLPSGLESERVVVSANVAGVIFSSAPPTGPATPNAIAKDVRGFMPTPVSPYDGDPYRPQLHPISEHEGEFIENARREASAKMLRNDGGEGRQHVYQIENPGVDEAAQTPLHLDLTDLGSGRGTEPMDLGKLAAKMMAPEQELERLAVADGGGSLQIVPRDQLRTKHDPQRTLNLADKMLAARGEEGAEQDDEFDDELAGSECHSPTITPGEAKRFGLDVKPPTVRVASKYLGASVSPRPKSFTPAEPTLRSPVDTSISPGTKK